MISCNGVNVEAKSSVKYLGITFDRYLLRYDCRHHIGFSDFKKANYLDVKGRVDYLAVSVMYNVFNNAAPSYMCDMNRIRHLDNTHGSNASYIVPHVKRGCKSFKLNGIKLWNELPVNVKTIQISYVFKKECKTILMNRMKGINEN